MIVIADDWWLLIVIIDWWLIDADDMCCLMIVAAIVDAIDIDITVIVIDITVITIVEGLVLSRSRLNPGIYIRESWFLGNAKLTSTPTKPARHQSQIKN